MKVQHTTGIHLSAVCPIHPKSLKTLDGMDVFGSPVGSHDFIGRREAVDVVENLVISIFQIVPDNLVTTTVIQVHRGKLGLEGHRWHMAILIGPPATL
jgi:hypothetical protein